MEPVEKKKVDSSAEDLNVAGAPVHSEDDSSESEQSDEELSKVTSSVTSYLTC